jgi:hypothetical protein
LYEGVINIFYAGNFYGGLRSPDTLLQSLEYLVDRNEIDIKNIKITIAGKKEDNVFASLISLKIFNQIEFLGVLDRQSTLGRMSKAHLLWLIEMPHGVFSMPIKMFEYMATRRPILAFVPQASEIANAINNLACGYIFSTEMTTTAISKNANLLLDVFHKVKNGHLIAPFTLNKDDSKKFLEITNKLRNV